MILRRSFLKALLAPLLAPLLKFLPKRKPDVSDWSAIDPSRVGAYEAESVFPMPRYKVRQFGDFWMVPDDKETIDLLLNR